MANKKGTGLLMVWGDVPADKEGEFNLWYNEEHIPDLLGLPGILNAARYEALKGGPKHLACYELDSPKALESEAWKRYHDNPTEWTRRVSYPDIATVFISNTYEMIHPAEVTPDVAQADMAPALLLGRMDIPSAMEDRFNEWYNTSYAPSYEKVPGCIRARRYRVIRGVPKYATVYELEHEKVSDSAEWVAPREASPIRAQARPDSGSPGVWRKTFQLSS